MTEMEITYRVGTYNGTEESGICHIWEIADDKGAAAWLFVVADTQVIANIEVRGDRRGQGLARALYDAATAMMTVYHDLPTHRSPDGDVFAQAVGGPEIEPYGCDCYGCTYNPED